MKSNPFILSGYSSPETFCDREDERSRIIDASENKRNMTLISSRRMGKTGLIYHVLDEINKNKAVIPVYFDILGTTNLREFIEAFGNSLINTIASTDSKLKRLMKSLGHLRPGLTFDHLSGAPKISLDIRTEQELIDSLDAIFNLISANDKLHLIAIDEFQQIGNYPEKNVEAILRTYIQKVNNVAFIFSGSKKHMLSEMFLQASRPFFGSTEMMFLNAIEADKYRSFIQYHFSKSNKQISEEAISQIFKYTSLHTFYVQFLCNRLFSSYKKINAENVDKELLHIVQENEPVYANYINLLTNTQYRTLRAVSIEGLVKSPTSNDFLIKHKLGAASSVAQAVDSLVKKEFLIEEIDGLILQDKFFMEWIRMKSN
jgi:hypothetical protein